MRNILLTLVIILCSLSWTLDVQAKRFGGGSNFGMKRSVSSFSNYHSSKFQQPIQKTVSTPNQGMSKWLGPLAGLAAGGLLASLFMGHGLGTGLLSWIMVIAGAFLLWRLLANRFQPAAQTMQSANLNSQPFQTYANESTFQNNHTFDEVGFLRQAKATFIRLQTAYDNKNLTDIREFTTPEVFAEIQLQLQERGANENHTEVVSIDSKLLDVSQESNPMIASILFSGLIREEKGAEPVSINEIWHFRQDNIGSTWFVAGIQQE